MDSIKSTKTVKFNDQLSYHYTYNSREYPRNIIDSVHYRLVRGEVKQFDMKKIYHDLRNYKLFEMPVHIHGLDNIYNLHLN